MAGREAPVHAHPPKQSTDARCTRSPHAPTPAGRSPGAAVQLAAVHRTLRRGPTLQRQAGGATAGGRTGLPDRLKSGIEALSGVSMDGVKVHYNSSKPARLNALAYAQGTDIHLGPGHEKHLPHEAWHIVQQAQGRVKPTAQLKSDVQVNDDAGLEHEADVMGERARSADPAAGTGATAQAHVTRAQVAQYALGFEFETHSGADNADDRQKSPAKQGHDSQSIAAQDSSAPGPALLEILGELEILSNEAEHLGEPEPVAKARALKPRLRELAKISNSSDKSLKAVSLENLRDELMSTPMATNKIDDGAAQGTSHLPVVQRVEGAVVGGIVGGAIVGLGAIVAGIFALVRSRRARARIAASQPLEEGDQTIGSRYAEVLAALEDVKEGVKRYELVKKTIRAAALIDTNAPLIAAAGPNARAKVNELVGELPSTGFDNESQSAIEQRAQTVLSAWESTPKETPEQLNLFNEGFGHDPCLAARLNGIAEFRAKQIGITDEALSGSAWDEELVGRIYKLIDKNEGKFVKDGKYDWEKFKNDVLAGESGIVDHEAFYASFNQAKLGFLL